MTQIFLHLRVLVQCDLLLSHFEVSYWFDCKEIGRHENVEEMRSGEEMKENLGHHCTSVVFDIFAGCKKTNKQTNKNTYIKVNSFLRKRKS